MTVTLLVLGVIIALIQLSFLLVGLLLLAAAMRIFQQQQINQESLDAAYQEQFEDEDDEPFEDNWTPQWPPWSNGDS